MSAHAVVLPVLLPLVAGSLLLLLGALGWQRVVRAVSLVATAALLLLAIVLVVQASTGRVQPYLLSNWQAPFGIALALDRLSALMLLLTAAVACAALVYALAGDDLRGAHFHVLFQFQLMGLNGAFLTADLFNLFVFFEVLLAASYGLLLHGATPARLRAALHYVVFNLTASALFLIAVSLLYALAGTLNLADLALKLAALGADDAALARAAALLLLLVFGAKAALLPLYFWLPDTYASASAPVAALFAILTKVGVYAIARTSTLLFGAAGGPLALVAGDALPWLAMATLTTAAIGALAARRLSVLVAQLVVASAGTLLLAIGLNDSAALAAGLFYLVNSTLVVAAWFLLADRIAAQRSAGDLLQPSALPAGWAALGCAFLVAATAVAGLPPLAGFFGKALLLQAAAALPLGPWVVASVLVSGLAVMVALARAGSVLFWQVDSAAPAPAPRPLAPAGRARRLAIGGLLAAVLAIALGAGPLAAYTQAAARQLSDRRAYIAAVLDARPVPAAYDVRREMREREMHERRVPP